MPPDYAAVLLVAPVHVGKHPKKLLAFLRTHRMELGKMPSKLLSVSLSQAGAENVQANDSQRSQAARDVESLVETLRRETGFPASGVAPVAGALAYSKYSFFKRLVMRRIAKQAGGSTDTSRDHIYTDYPKLDTLVDEFAAQLSKPAVRVVGL